MIKENLKDVEKRIEDACLRSGRKREEVTLIAVSKTKPLAMIEEAIEAGLTEFGENKVQELTEKIPAVKEEIRWHMIGHLQRNKVKYIVDQVCLIHSVDSYRLAEQINIEAEKKGIVCNILIEVNIGDEDSKFGVKPEEVEALIREIAVLSHVSVRGLMCVAPYTEIAEENRKYFKQMKQLSVDINEKNIDNVYMDKLSMGMTGDFEVAIEEGATLVRVGTGIFGERNYNRGL
ncbi:MAG: YggS family pyridoxal phosphate-dependent enzyme [Lachnospiraceae bacterium]|nr:YggS family pyridoxal phosphate-dependent enzyme [Lachnospiraceae bacterium]